MYGSKPLKKYRNTEPDWFGGLLGGHVGIEGYSDRIVSLMPAGFFHILAKKMTATADGLPMIVVHSMGFSALPRTA